MKSGNLLYNNFGIIHDLSQFRRPSWFDKQQKEQVNHLIRDAVQEEKLEKLFAEVLLSN